MQTHETGTSKNSRAVIRHVDDLYQTQPLPHSRYPSMVLVSWISIPTLLKENRECSMLIAMDGLGANSSGSGTSLALA